jgi:L-ascorbate 6-phosphate lactonase
VAAGPVKFETTRQRAASANGNQIRRLSLMLAMRAAYRYGRMRPVPGFGHRLATDRPQPGGLLIFALGQAGYALRAAETLVLIDPWLSTQLEEEAGITRHVAPALRPEEVQAADLVCITHEHADHLDPRALGAIAAQVPDAIFLAPAPAVPLLEAAGVDRGRLHPALDGVALEAAGARVTALRAAHELHPDAFGGYRFWRDERGDHRCLSYLVELDGHAIFHAGDTVWWPGLEDALRELHPDVAILPINGRDAMREAEAVWGNLNAEEAAALAVAAGVPAVVPCHYDGVAGNLGDPDAFVAALRARGRGIAAHPLAPGDALPLPG